MLCNNQKPDILQIDPVIRNIEIIEVTTCYDLYFQLARNGKIEKHTPFVNVLVQLSYNAKLHVLFFGSLKILRKNVIVLFEKYAETDLKQTIF